MRDTGRIECYRAEWELGEQVQLPWDELMGLARRVITDEQVRSAYPQLVKRPLKLRPVMSYKRDFIGMYEPWTHRIKLAWGGRSAMVLMHELAHAAVAGKHGQAWRTAYVFLVWRFLGEEQGRRLAAAFINHGVI